MNAPARLALVARSRPQRMELRCAHHGPAEMAKEGNLQPLTPSGETAVQNLAHRYGVSVDAAKTLLMAVNAGGGSMAQFYHPELGGGGQWMRGGMTMVGDMFNNGLQATVAGLCSELSALLSSQQVFQASVPSPYGTGGPANHWWPGGLGNPSSSGGQNDCRYAYFPETRRLAIDRGGRVTVYDTLDHQIGGVQQQQGGAWGSLSFSSQFGTFTVDSLPIADQPTYENNRPDSPPQQQPQPPLPNASYGEAPQTLEAFNTQSHDEILTTLERLSGLHQKGILSEDEFRTKKAELLKRL
jgi:putative oligomerization/nucleic acid binding protein